MAPNDASVVVAGAGIPKVRQFVVRANEMRGVAPAAVLPDVADVAHPAVDSASPQASAAAYTARSSARPRRVLRLTRM